MLDIICHYITVYFLYHLHSNGHSSTILLLNIYYNRCFAVLYCKMFSFFVTGEASCLCSVAEYSDEKYRMHKTSTHQCVGLWPRYLSARMTPKQSLYILISFIFVSVYLVFPCKSHTHLSFSVLLSLKHGCKAVPV